MDNGTLTEKIFPNERIDSDECRRHNWLTLQMLTRRKPSRRPMKVVSWPTLVATENRPR